MSTNPTQDDALAFQSSALAGATDLVDSPDDTYTSEDPLGNSTLTKDHLAKRAGNRERYTERPRLEVRGVAYHDPEAIPQRINGRRLTEATRERDRAAMLDNPIGKNAKSKKSTKESK